jgi:hypothetical protein
MVYGVCGSAIVKASGKAGGYCGCLAAAKGSGESRTLVRRTLAERMILGAVRERLADAESLRYVFEKVEAEVAKLLAAAPDDIRQKEAELDAISRKIAHFVEFDGQGPGSKALAEALMLAEKKAEALNGELDGSRPFSRFWREGRSVQRSCSGSCQGGFAWSRSSPTSAGPTSRPPPSSSPWLSWSWTPPPRARRRVRILCDGGGGGSRTHIAKRCANRDRRLPRAERSEAMVDPAGKM